MAHSGVKIDDLCVEKWTDLKKGTIKGCIFRLSDDMKCIIVDEDSLVAGTRNPNPDDFENFMSKLEPGKCRYAVYNFEIDLKSSDGMNSKRDKMVFITWAPDDARIKDKMLTASSKDALKKKLDGIAIEFQCSCETDIQAQNFIEKLQDLPNVKLAGEVVSFEGRQVGDW